MQNKSKFNVVEGFILSDVSGNRCCMHQIKYDTTKGSWDNNTTHMINSGDWFVIYEPTFKYSENITSEDPLGSLRNDLILFSVSN